MFAFLALTLEMIQTEVQDEMEQLRCPFREQAVVHLRSYHIHRFLQFTDNGRNGVDRMDESHERQWTIWGIFEILRTDFSEFHNPSENLAVDSYCEIQGKNNFQAVYIPKKQTSCHRSVWLHWRCCMCSARGVTRLRSKCGECDATVHGWKLLRRLPQIGWLPENLFVHPLYKVLKPWSKCEYQKVDIHKCVETSTLHDIYSIFKVYWALSLLSP